MRILTTQRVGGAFGYITDSWISALRDMGHVAERWDGLEASWHQFGPDLYVGCSGHKQPIPANRGDTKVAIHVNPYGQASIKGIDESKESIDWVAKQKPNVVFGYGQDRDRAYWSRWESVLGIKWVPLPTAGDKLLFRLTTSIVDRPYDIVYLGGRWPYKGKIIDKFLLPVLMSPAIKSKLHGWGDWPPGLSAGILPEDKPCEFLNSGKVGPCISEQHTCEYGIDIPERAFKVALCGTLVVHDNTEAIKFLIPSALIARTPEQYYDLCYYYSRPENIDQLTTIVSKQRQEVLDNHTYHHRMATLINSL